jgi:hypothetical protein
MYNPTMICTYDGVSPIIVKTDGGLLFVCRKCKRHLRPEEYYASGIKYRRCRSCENRRKSDKEKIKSAARRVITATLKREKRELAAAIKAERKRVKDEQRQRKEDAQRMQRERRQAFLHRLEADGYNAEILRKEREINSHLYKSDDQLKREKEEATEAFRARTYGIPVDQIKHMRSECKDLCMSCGEPEPGKKRLAVDHCHATGVVRGLLCSRCNTALGLLQDNSTRLRKLAIYIDTYREGYHEPSC